jgi:putative phage-type endonuclease
MITTEILRQRRSGIGGSDVAAILGMSRYRTPLQVYYEKTNDDIIDDDLVSNKYVYWGNRLEPIVAEEYASKNGAFLKEPTEMYRHKEYPFLIANPDRLIIGQKGVLECKTSSSYKNSEWGEDGTDEIPTEYLLQVAHYRYVLEADFVDIAVLIGGNDYRQYRYVENKNLESKMLDKLTAFWKERVEKKIPPEPTTRREIETMLQATDRVLEADDELEKDLCEIAKLSDEKSKLEESIDKIKDRVCVRIGDASKVVSKLGEKICSYSEVVSKRFNTSLFKKEHPAEYEQYQQPSKSRQLRINNAFNWGV